MRSSQLRAVPVLDDPLLLVCSPKSEAGPVQLVELRNTTLLVLPTGTGLKEQIEAALDERGVACHLVEYPTAETIKTAVALGMGATILPASAVQEDLRSGKLATRAMRDWPSATRVVHLVVRAEGRPSPAVAAFMSLLLAHYRV